MFCGDVKSFYVGGKAFSGDGKYFYGGGKCICTGVKCFCAAVKCFCAGIKCFPAATILLPISHLRYYAARNVVSRDVGVAPTEWINDFHGNSKTVRGES